ncbi:uncharacterized protein T551_01532 [Pneumocystis jirovecii RU7]|uniref:Uncharacterized protein n=1 Tax=Pneumocystis jirovecii (strain RU7) TaxID=1408657 RepID=A0A0W4ZRI0_PNEJ7|nr:uncharacterized protein T551_01532 [Pneumocystis jirovecii RU7]KTW30980.1 hypothetical protein T551_01532 [Pneumocystis jirovecii RU7]
MLNRIKANRHIFLKQQVRRFFQSSYQHQDIVQELYLRALRSCKPYTVKPTDSEGQVKLWELPNPPKIPEMNLDVDARLDAYEKDNVTEASAAADTANPLDTLFEEEKKDMQH